jgi:hypothetical protein
MNEKRGHLYLFTGLIIGLLVGVLIAMMLPARTIDTDPSLLNSADKNLYRALIARAYLVEADNTRAQARLDLLGDVNSEDALVAQAQQLLAAGSSETESRALALLAAGLHQGAAQITPLPPMLQQPTAEPLVITTSANPTLDPTTASTNSPENTPTQGVVSTQGVTVTARSTSTPLSTERALFALEEQSEVCNAAQPGSLIQVYVYNRADNPVAGVRIEISITDAGMEAFYTGLYPEISPGYADYLMTKGMTYNLRVGVGGQLIQNLSIPQCTGDGGSAFAGSIELVFKKQD